MHDKKWVFDTVSISNFLLSESGYIIKNRYGQKAIVTTQVLDELAAGFTKYPILKTIDNLIDDKIFNICNMDRKEREIYIDLCGQLGKGEASCIAVAKEQRLIAVTDDMAARKRCSQMGVTVTGTIGIIKASLLDGRITASEANNILHKMTSFGFYSPVRKIDNLI